MAGLLDQEYMDVMRILLENAEKPFVRRVLSPDAYPSMDAGNGQRATHKMAWSEVDGRFVVYPTITLGKSGLLQLEDDEALSEALTSGNFIEFDSPERADWFSQNYKKAWKR